MTNIQQVTCDDCGKLFVPKDSNKLYDEKFKETDHYCDECIDNYFICDSCGRVEKYDPDFSTSGYCEDCY